MKRAPLLNLLLLLTALNACSQVSPQDQDNNGSVQLNAGCEGCEAIYESPLPFEKIPSVITLPGFNDAGPKIEISGIIYQADGITPAKDVVLYIYHTDQNGRYATRGDENGWGKRHGYIRGWVKTDQQGAYTIYTQVPASYPNSNNPKHIHPIIKEPGKSEYWIDEFVFDDDPLLPASERTRPRPRGGDGVLKTTMKDGMLYAQRNIILGKNIPGYPKAVKTTGASGLYRIDPAVKNTVFIHPELTLTGTNFQPAAKALISL